LLIAPFWLAWHFPLFFIEGTTQSAWGIGTLSFWLFVVTIIPLSILFTWAYAQNRRSILAPILLHFAYNFTLSLVYPLPMTVNLLHTTGLLIAAAAVVLFADSRP
jgi:membrane protease YdiL (CAAX protease family)